VVQILDSSISDSDLAELIKRYENIDETYQTVRKARQDLRDRILMAMNHRQATLFTADGIEVKLEPGKPDYDPEILRPLLEMDQSAELASKAMEVVTIEKWNGTKLNKIAQLGGAYKQIVDEATMRGPEKIKIKRKETA